MDSAADVVVIGGGQSALAVGYFLRRRTKRDFVLLDAQDAPGGAWLHGWDSLRLFSPARWSSLPGWAFPPPPRDAADADECPSRDDVIRYLAAYEARYELPARRPVRVRAVRRRRNDPTDGDGFLVETDRGDWRARAVVSATGTWGRPFVPDYPGRESFRGEQFHSAHYRSPDAWAGKRVLVVGGGNSGAQILAEVSRVAAEAVWVTLTPPRFLPDDVDGRVLFAEANREFAALGAGGEAGAASGDGGESPLGSIVMVPSVREARARGVLRSVPPFSRFTARGVVWPDGRETSVDAVVWCTGFRPALEHLRPLGVLDAGGRVAVPVDGARCPAVPGLWLVGYGDWCGYGSATLYGVGKIARQAVQEIDAYLGPGDGGTP